MVVVLVASFSNAWRLGTMGFGARNGMGWVARGGSDEDSVDPTRSSGVLLMVVKSWSGRLAGVAGVRRSEGRFWTGGSTAGVAHGATGWTGGPGATGVAGGEAEAIATDVSGGVFCSSRRVSTSAC